MIERDRRKVVVTDIRMSFWSMVLFMVKWSIASIPALIILVIIMALSAFALFGVLANLGVPFPPR